MTTTTSQVHSETVSGWSPIGPLVSGMAGSLAFTILTGLVERLVFPLPSAFRTGYGPRCLSAQGQSRDLQHLSPMLTRCGNSALRDMAHVIVRPVNAGKPHSKRSSLKNTVPEHACPSTVALEARLSHDRFGSGTGEGEDELSQSVKPGGTSSLSPSAFNSSIEQVYSCSSPVSRGLVTSLMYKEQEWNLLIASIFLIALGLNQGIISPYNTSNQQPYLPDNATR